MSCPPLIQDLGQSFLIIIKRKKLRIKINSESLREKVTDLQIKLEDQNCDAATLL
jgi:hypothetical protein